MIISHTPFIDQIYAKWDGRCASCGCPYVRGQQVLYQPRVGIAPLVTHVKGECGGTYTVKVVYRATSQSYSVDAYSADQAMDKVEVKLRNRLARPVHYVCYQGSFVVKQRLALVYVKRTVVRDVREAV